MRALPFSARYRRSLSAALRKVVGQVKPLEQELARLQRKLEQAPAANSGAAAAIRKELKMLSAQLQTLEDKCGSSSTELRRTLQIVERGEMRNGGGEETAD